MRYRTGEEVRVGDVVTYLEWGGIVEGIFPPGTEFNPDDPTDDDSAMVLLSYGDRFLIENAEDDAHVEFVRRSDAD